MSGITSLPPTRPWIQTGILIGLGPELYPATISFDPFILQKCSLFFFSSSFSFPLFPFTFSFFCCYLPLRLFTSPILLQSVPRFLFSLASCQPFFRFTLPPTPWPVYIQIADLGPTTLTDIQQSQIWASPVVSLASILNPAIFLPLLGGKKRLRGNKQLKKPFAKGSSFFNGCVCHTGAHSLK